MKADVTNVILLRQTRDQYCDSHGQMASDLMCSIFLGSNLNIQLKYDICSKLNIMTEALSDNTLASQPW